MTNAIEVKKDGLSQLQDGCWKLVLKVHPNDMPHALMIAPMGSRYGMALVAIADDEKTEPVFKGGYTEGSEPEKTEGQRAVKRAATKCSEDSSFQLWITQQVQLPAIAAAIHDGDWKTAAEIALRHRCGVQSRAELATNPDALEKFKAIETSFRYRDSTR